MLELSHRMERLQWLLDRMTNIPPAWIDGRVLKGSGSKKSGLEPLPCEEWAVLEQQWSSPDGGMEWSDQLSRALATMLASIISVPVKGDQLWIRLIGPPSCGKSTLCDGLAIADRYVVLESNIKGFHSGWKVADGKKDCSLLARLRDCTLVTKDGDTLLQNPALPQILAEARDLYDRFTTAHFKNGIHRRYDKYNMTWILCGTPSLRQLDSSELGERFLTCRIMTTINEVMETKINTGKLGSYINQLSDDPLVNTIDVADSHTITRAKRMTGGYIGFLRENIAERIKAVRFDADAQAAIKDMADFVAYMRSRPSKKQQEEYCRELSTRLVVQFAKLAYCFCVVTNKREVNEEILKLCRETALDTSFGLTASICTYLHRQGDEGLTWAAIAAKSHLYRARDSENIIHFLKNLKAVHEFKDGHLTTYRLTPRINYLWQQVVGKRWG